MVLSPADRSCAEDISLIVDRHRTVTAKLAKDIREEREDKPYESK